MGLSSPAEGGQAFFIPYNRAKFHGWKPQKSFVKTHSLGPKTREWMVSSRQVPGFGATHTRIAGFSEGARRL